MSFSLFKHSCGGNLHPDITHLFSIRTPSLSIGPGGINIGTVEIQMKSGKSVRIKFRCDSCNELVSPDEPESLVSKCLTCNQLKPIEEMSTSHQIPAICDSCVTVLTEGYTGEIPSVLKPVAEYVTITPEFKLSRISSVFDMNLTI